MHFRCSRRGLRVAPEVLPETVLLRAVVRKREKLCSLKIIGCETCTWIPSLGQRQRRVLRMILLICGFRESGNTSSLLVLITVSEEVNNQHACSDTDRNISDIKSGPKEILTVYTELKKINNFTQIESVNEIPDSSPE